VRRDRIAQIIIAIVMLVVIAILAEQATVTPKSHHAGVRPDALASQMLRYQRGVKQSLPTTTSTSIPAPTTTVPIAIPVPIPTTVPVATTTTVPYTASDIGSDECGLGTAANVLRAEAGGVPCAWVPTAVCEEQGYDDPVAGYFGIQQWNGYDGIAEAGEASLSDQLAWEASVGQDEPPDAPGQCAGY